MGNPKMRTKPRTKPIDPAKAVKGYVTNILQFGGEGFAFVIPSHETWVYEARPVFSDPHSRRITFHGRTHVTEGWAKYEGEYGTWIISLVAERGDGSPEAIRTYPCTRVWGTPYCTQVSEEWRETKEQRRERLIKLFEQYPMTEKPNERWSWYQEGHEPKKGPEQP